MIRRALYYQRQITGESFLTTTRRYFTFLVPGFLSWLFLIATHTILNEYYAAAVSYGIGILITLIFAFVFHSLVTFNVKSNWKSRFIKFTGLVALVSAANWALFVMGREILNLPVPDFVMSFFITGFLSVINFLLNRIFIFRDKKSA